MWRVYRLMLPLPLRRQLFRCWHNHFNWTIMQLHSIKFPAPLFGRQLNWSVVPGWSLWAWTVKVKRGQSQFPCLFCSLDGLSQPSLNRSTVHSTPHFMQITGANRIPRRQSHNLEPSVDCNWSQVFIIPNALMSSNVCPNVDNPIEQKMYPRRPRVLAGRKFS